MLEAHNIRYLFYIRGNDSKVSQCAIWHNVVISVNIYRTEICSVDNRLTQLPDASRNTRSMPDEFINEASNCIFILPNTCNYVTDMFKYYLLPLLESNIPQTHRLRAPMVEKKLNK